MTTLSSDFVVIKYSNEVSLGSVETISLNEVDSIKRFLVQAIKCMSSESYVKHYLTVFKTTFVVGWFFKLVR